MYGLGPEYIEVICYSRLSLLSPQTIQWHAKVCGFIGLSTKEAYSNYKQLGQKWFRFSKR